MNMCTFIGASNWQDAVLPVIMLTIVVGSWIFNQLKEMQAPPSQHDNEDEAGTSEDLDESASQQRTLAQRSGRPSIGDAVKTEPENLTLAERIERARARAQYKKRAEMLRRQSPQDTQNRSAQLDGSAHSGPRSSEPRVATPLKPALTRTRLSHPLAHHRTAMQRPDTVMPSQTMSMSAPTTRRIKSKQKAPDTPSPESASSLLKTKIQPVRNTAIFTRGLSARSLRQAIVLKEILDRPVCLRDPFDTLS